MTVQAKTSPDTETNFLRDLFFIGTGLTVGGVVALVGLWLWLDYQADPAHSLLTGAGHTIVTALPQPLHAFLQNEARLMGLPLTGETSAFWYMARSGGIVAYVMLWLSTVWGLGLSTKVIKGWLSPALAFGLHEFLSISTLIFTAIHGLVLLGDAYIEFNLLHLLIPFIGPYEPLWTGLGIITFYLGLTVTASFYSRKLIGQSMWRLLHYLTFPAYLLALLHGVMVGTDSSRLGMMALYAGTGLSVLFLVYYRLFTLRGTGAAKP